MLLHPLTYTREAASCPTFLGWTAEAVGGAADGFSGGRDGKAEPATDTYQLEVPARDRITFLTLIARMGWPAFSLRKTIGQVAAF